MFFPKKYPKSYSVFYCMQEICHPKIYIFPPQRDHEELRICFSVDYLTVGGTTQIGDWNSHVDVEDSAAIWEKALAVFPMLRVCGFCRFVDLQDRHSRERLDKAYCNADKHPRICKMLNLVFIES